MTTYRFLLSLAWWGVCEAAVGSPVWNTLILDILASVVVFILDILAPVVVTPLRQVYKLCETL